MDDQSNAIDYKGRKVEMVMNNKIEMREKVEMVANRLCFKQRITKIKSKRLWQLNRNRKQIKCERR